jgi:transcriptional regulator with XRE-family HTH domain
MASLTELLRRYQQGQSDAEYARTLGISAAMLSMIYSGARNPGLSVVRRLIRAYPAASGEVGAALVADGIEDEREAVSA